jgi:DNA-binding NarL/FixJ family response regulator
MALLNVLLIEDNLTFREVLKEYLEEHFPFMVIEEAANCGQALQRIHEISPHLIFMDMNLPEMNGLKLTQEIKKEFPDIHIAIITGYDLLEYQQAALQAGADRLYQKDALKWEELENFINSISHPSAPSAF